MTTFSLGFNSVEQTALKGIRQSTAGIVRSVTRLSTGKRINSAKDDPAGLIASELLKSENTELRAKLKTNKELGNKLAVKDSYLSQVSNLLIDIKGAVVEGANTGALSDSEIDALQLQIDYSLDAIQRMGRTATYKGEKLLDGLFQSLGQPFNAFGNLSGVGNSSEESTCTVETTSTGLLRTNALSDFTGSLFADDKEDKTGIGELVELLQLIAQSLEGGGSTAVELPEEELTDEDSEAEDVDPVAEELEGDDLAAESVAEAVQQQMGAEEEAVETAAETILAETVSEEEADPFMTFFDEERQRDEATFLAGLSETEIVDTDIAVEEADEAETDEMPSAYVITEADVEATEEEAEKTIEEEKKEFDPASTYLSGEPGEYWFRELDEFDFLNYADSEETMATAATIISGLAGDRIGKLENLLIPNSFSLDINNVLETETLETEDEEDEEEELLGGRLSDLYSGEGASLRNDPERADRIIEEAIRGVSMMRAQIGSEQKYTVDVNTVLFQDQLVANTETLSQITDADFAEEMSNLARFQVLLQVNLKVLSYSQNMTQTMVNMLLKE